jgi:hypothetical protein
MEERYCTHCDRPLNPNKIVWLEKSFETNRWFPEHQCPPKESQGHFPFGAACARKTLKKQDNH